MMSLEWMTDTQAWVALLTLTLMEIVLGIDNIVFISILVDKLPEHLRRRARFVGLSLAMAMRILLLFSISWIMRLTEPLFSVLEYEISGRDLVLIVGGLFLLAKATKEIHERVEGEDHEGHAGRSPATFGRVLVQIALLDMIFSLDSVITAVGMARHIEVMVIAVVVAVLFMMALAGAVSDFISRHPTVKMLALSFLLLIGVALVADGLDLHIPKGYIYFAMAFSVMVEVLNLRVHRSRRAAAASR